MDMDSSYCPDVQRAPDIFNVEEIKQGLYQLYHDPEQSNKLAADRWLQSVQQSPQAWDIAWVLLQQNSVEVQNFGALTLCKKISTAWTELPQDQYGPLQHELFKAVAKFSPGPKLILIQLCRSLVAMAFNTMPHLWPNTLVSCIQSIRFACQSMANANFSNAILQFLTIFPEEFESISVSITASRRGIIRNELCRGLQSVLFLLEEVLSSAHLNETKIDAMRCCCSWVQFGLPLPEITSLIDLLYRCLSVPELLETSSNTLQEMLSHDDSFKYPKFLRRFLHKVLEIKDFILRQIEDNDLEVCLSLAQLVLNVASANLDVLMGIEEERGDDVDECLEIVQLVVEFTCVSGNYPVDELCSEVSLSFWSNFLDQIASAEPDRSRFLVEFYRSSISTLVEVLPDKAQYPLEKSWDDWIDDDQDSFIKYREDLCDVGECLQRIVHMEYLQHLSGLLSTLLSTSQTPSWQSIEAGLYLLQGVTSHIHQQSSHHLQNILSLFPKMPPHPVLVKTALALFGCMAGWFKHHISLLQSVLPMILDALGQPSLAPSAALAFRDVCGDCASELAPIVSQIVPICEISLSNPALDSRDCVRVISAVGNVLSSMPLQDLISPLKSLVKDRVQSLQMLAMADTTQSSKVQVEKELVVLASLCHHIYPTLKSGEQHPVVLLLVQLFPSLQALISKWCTDQDIVECICVCFNRAMRSVNEQYTPLLEGTVEIVVKCYAAVHHAKLLDSAAQIVEIFGMEASYSQLIKTLITELHSTSVQVFQSGIQNHPDTVQAYLGMITAVLKTCPQLVTESEDTALDIFEIGLTALQLPEQPTVTVASAFFVTYISLTPSLELVRKVFQTNGCSLLQYVIQAIASAAPRSYLQSFTDIISSLNSHMIALLSQWLEDLLSQDGYPSTHLTPVEKQNFKSTLLKEQASKRTLREKVKEFALMCRGYHGTVYAAEIS